MKRTKETKFFYGWVIVGCLFLISLLPMTFISSFYSYYQMPICEEFGCSYVEFSISNSTSTIAGMLFSLTLAGKISKGNTRLYMLFGGLVSALALLAQSSITAVWQLYITFFIVNFTLSAITYVPMNFLISQWFIDKKGLITSIVFTGSGIGGMLFSGFVAKIIANQGWRAGFRLTALITAVTIVVVCFLIRKSPAEMDLEPYRSGKNNQQKQKTAAAGPGWEGLSKAEAIKTGAFWLYAACLIFCGIVAAGIFTQVPTYLIENGLDYAPVMALASLAMIIGKLIAGPLVDKLGIQKGIAITCLFGAIGLIILLLVPGMGAAAAFTSMLIIPLGTSITSVGPPLLTSKVFGNKEFGGIYGLGNTFFMGGCMIGPMLSSGIRTAVGSYTMAWIVFVIVFLALAGTAALAVKSGKTFQTAA